MSFGKRTPGERPQVRKVLMEVSARAKAEAASVTVEDAPAAAPKRIQFDKPDAKDAKGKRPKAVNPEKKSGGNGAFLALALGVMAISAGGAFAAPEVISWAQNNVFGTPVRPIHTVIAGLSHDQARAALASEAFPDADGRAFMTALAANYPDDHAKLLDRITEVAVGGGDRKDMVVAMNEWVVAFTPQNLGAMSRAGATGFDESLDVANDALTALAKFSGGACTLDKLKDVAANPALIDQLGGYGSDSYKLGMRASKLLVDMAATGRNAPPVEAKLLPEDNTALQGTVMSLMRDPQVAGLLQMSAQGFGNGGKTFAFGPGGANPGNLDVCKLGHVAIGKLKSLPQGTKSRLWAVAFSNVNAQTIAQMQKLAAMQGGA
ncbi:MAG TPA: hypothetical protein VG942_03970 [Hyphomonadaceae bacterium]|nr:hypothetical protein [Hyphomonadaceae bacterium]